VRCPSFALRSAFWSDHLFRAGRVASKLDSMNNAMANRLDHYEVTMAPYRVGRTVVWLPPSADDSIAAIPVGQSAMAELWQELERTSQSAAGLSGQAHEAGDAEIIDLDAARARRKSV